MNIAIPESLRKYVNRESINIKSTVSHCETDAVVMIVTRQSDELIDPSLYSDLAAMDDLHPFRISVLLPLPILIAPSSVTPPVALEFAFKICTRLGGRAIVARRIVTSGVFGCENLMVPGVTGAAIASLVNAVFALPKNSSWISSELNSSELGQAIASAEPSALIVGGVTFFSLFDNPSACTPVQNKLRRAP